MRTRRQRTIQPPNDAANRSGFFMPFLAIMLVMLLGFVGLVIDVGRLHRAQREAQNAADAAAMAAAMAKLRGLTDEEVLAEANSIRAQNCPDSLPLIRDNGTKDAMNIPPVAGPHADANSVDDLNDYVEVYVTVPVQTLFVHILGIEQNREVAARAVAGNEPPAGGEGVIVLDPQAIAGISVSGAIGSGTIVKVDGGVLINSLGNGWNQWGQPVTTWPAELQVSPKDPAVSTQTTNDPPSPSIEAKNVIVAGGTSHTNAAAYKMYGDTSYPNGKNPLFAGTGLLFPDPLRDFLVPQPSLDDRVTTTVHTQLNVQSPKPGEFNFGTGDVATLQPGLYHDIVIQGSASVTFSPGVYILSPNQPNQGLRINGSPTIVGDGVMFYVTGDNYLTADQEPGYWDALDDSTNNQLDGPLPLVWSAPDENTVWNQKSLPPGNDPYNGKVTYATVDINVGDGVLDLKGLAETGGEFDNMLFFARRRNNQTIKIAGNAGTAQIRLEGVFYSKWSLLDISGGGQWKAQFVIGSLKVSGGGVVTIEGFGYSWKGISKKVYLVE